MAASLFRVALLFALVLPLASALSTNYYARSCPKLLQIVKPIVNEAIKREARLGASILRLFFHDCIVNGCDGSLLLDDTPTFTGEKTAIANTNTRGFDVIDDIKDAVEKECPGVVSCADILAIATQVSVRSLKGPVWHSLLGRLDARTASKELANTNIPSFRLSLDELIQSFQKVGLSEKDLVVLSGAHTVGVTRCALFRNRIYNDANIDPIFAAKRQETCPLTGGNNNLAPLDINSEEIFDNSYYKNLVLKKGLLDSDQEIFNGGSTDNLVLEYSKKQPAFFKDFKASMIKMGNIKPSTGTPLEVRKNCRFVN